MYTAGEKVHLFDICKTINNDKIIFKNYLEFQQVEMSEKINGYYLKLKVSVLYKNLNIT